jgi:hypothetical protein
MCHQQCCVWCVSLLQLSYQIVYLDTTEVRSAYYKVIISDEQNLHKLPKIILRYSPAIILVVIPSCGRVFVFSNTLSRNNDIL